MRGGLWLWGPVALAVLVRLALWLGGGLWALEGSELMLDTIEYHELAESLSEGEGFVYEHPEYAPPYDVEALRTPGYPAFVAAVYAVVGPRPGWVLLLQIVLDGATCLLLALTLRQWLDERAAAAAALALALHPAASLYSQILLSESLFVFLLVASVWLLWRTPRGDGSPDGGRVAAAGALLGLAVLVKPVALWALPVLAIVRIWTHRPLARSVRQSAALVALAALVVTPWMVRNAAVQGAAMLSTSGDYNALALYAAPVHARATGLSQGVATRALLARSERRAREARPESGEFRDVDRAPYWRAEAVDVLRRHPITVVELEARGLVRMFASIGRVSRQHVFGAREAAPRAPGVFGAFRWWMSEPLRDKVLDLWALLYACVAYLLVGVGIVRAVRERRSGLFLAAGALAAFFLLTTAIPGYSRFLVPAVPFLAAFAGLAASRREPASRPEPSPVERA